MKNKHKIILVKVVISLTAIFMTLGVVLATTSKLGLHNDLNEETKILAYVLIAIGFFFGFIMIALMFKIDIRPEKTKPKKYKIMVNDFNELKQVISKNIKEDNYSELKVYENNRYKIDFWVKSKFREQYIVALLNLEELTEEIYQEFKDNYFEEFGNYLIQNNEIKQSKSINLICIICINKKNKVFNKYVERNLYQDYQRYNLPVGIDMENKELYIATQNEGMAPNKYRKLKRMFEKYIEDIKQYRF